MPSPTQASLTASRVAKLSLPSMTRSWPPRSCCAHCPASIRSCTGVDFDEVVEALHELQREIGLRIAGVALAKERLAMEIGELDHVVVDDRESPDTGAGERRDDRAADAAGADHRDARGLELPLPNAADLRQDDVPRVALELVRRRGSLPRRAEAPCAAARLAQSSRPRGSSPSAPAPAPAARCARRAAPRTARCRGWRG